jgi:hypothetical protein
MALIPPKRLTLLIWTPALDPSARPFPPHDTAILRSCFYRLWLLSEVWSPQSNPALLVRSEEGTRLTLQLVLGPGLRTNLSGERRVNFSIEEAKMLV